MNRITQAIEAHERDLSKRPADRRRGFLELWRQFRRSSPAEPVIKTEQGPEVIEALDFWIPLLEAGYRVDPSPHPGRLLVTTLTGSGIASRTLETQDPCDPRIPKLVAELRNLPF